MADNQQYGKPYSQLSLTFIFFYADYSSYDQNN